MQILAGEVKPFLSSIRQQAERFLPRSSYVEINLFVPAKFYPFFWDKNFALFFEPQLYHE